MEAADLDLAGALAKAFVATHVPGVGVGKVIWLP